MARTVSQKEYTAKRNAILNIAQALVLTKGYEKMSIQDILRELGMSNGAFFHYFDSKAAVLEALVDRMLQEAEQPLITIVHDPHLPAVEKLQGFFATIDRLRAAQKTFLIKLTRVWYADENAIIRQKVDAATIDRRTPLLTKIVYQGIQEGVFTTLYPDQAGEIILSLAFGMNNSLAKLIILFDRESNEAHFIECVVSTYAAYMHTIERMLGIPLGYLHRPNADTVKAWVTALQDYS